ncbi:MAG: RNA polymerase sigma factor [Planctomycetota bacterium]|nr:MAG: RNA polymerase sigma factor [Planctomycetota bacterium]REJ87188.1 MAG: RNA polymerase sigma factor [Planctomycetota bacterium]REK23848.1 MAG: RNA polymerase sigma factor [Planctomycetota bacterium]REK44717.1 MAG: RNA polymerase sigma factor [Planctomycetota bacterium]
MSPASESDQLLVRAVRAGDESAWQALIDRYEGRLQAFVESRIGNRAASEDVVQETLIGFLTSLPNFDESRPLESYLFSIAAHKLTDHLRREGRRPTMPLATAGSRSDWELPDGRRAVSSLARSTERRRLEADAVALAMGEILSHWHEKQDWAKVKCLELLLVRGLANKQVAAELDLTEQQVASFKFDFVSRIRKSVRRQDLSTDVFPELAS